MKETAAKRAFQVLLEEAKEREVDAPAYRLQLRGFSSSQASNILVQLEQKGLIERIYWAKGSGRGIAAITILKEEFPEPLLHEKKPPKIKSRKIAKLPIQATLPPPILSQAPPISQPPISQGEEKKKEKPPSLRGAFRVLYQEKRKKAKERGRRTEERVALRLDSLQKKGEIQRWWGSIPYSATDARRKIDFSVCFLSGIEVEFQIKSSEFFAKRHRKQSDIPVIVVGEDITDEQIEQKILELSYTKC